MIRAFRHLARFRHEEAGTATVEFVLVFPLFLSVMMMAIELGFITLRHTLLERGLDMAVREVRLGTGTAPEHDEIKQLVCDNAMFILECETNLQLEMRPADIRTFNSLDRSVDCTDKAEPSKPVRQFTPGQQNELMLLRACVRYDPIFPDEFLGSALSKDANGQAAIVSMTAFVQEPL
jgi:hypothetical protein